MDLKNNYPVPILFTYVRNEELYELDFIICEDKYKL